MSIFNELISPKLNEIRNSYIKNYENELQAAFECLDMFEQEIQNEKAKTREKTAKDKTVLTTLKCINEDGDEPKTADNDDSKSSTDERSSVDSSTGKRGSKKRSKNEVDGILSPEQDKRQKRNASVKAQSIISKQVNVNLTQKLRRENSVEKCKNRRHKDDNKENTLPIIIPAVQIKQEKISLPPETMDTEMLPVNEGVKQEADKDEIAMPPPTLPVPKPRKPVQRVKSEESSDEEPTRRRTTRTKKKTDTQPTPVASTRATRASNRMAKQIDSEESVVAETRPKRTRGKKIVPEIPKTPDAGKESRSTQDSGIVSSTEKPRPKRTRRVRKATEVLQETPKPVEQPVQQAVEPLVQQAVEQPEEPIISPKEERLSEPDYALPLLLQTIVTKTKKANNKTVIVENTKIMENGIDEIHNGKYKYQNGMDKIHNEVYEIKNGTDKTRNGNKELEQTRVIASLDTLSSDSKAMNETVVLSNGLSNHAPDSTKNHKPCMNETVVIETCNQTLVLDKPTVMDATVVIEKGTISNLTDDHSIITDDESLEMKTPPKLQTKVEPTSAVKEKIQQFEELGSRVTRTKTRALAKKVEDTDKQTPPDKVSKVVLSVDTLSKMNNMIFNGKSSIPVSSSASKPRAIAASSAKAFSSTSKISGINRMREAAEESKKEDARKKKEAMLEAKRELQKRKREEKMAAAAAAREAAERERRAALAAAAKERQEKQMHADMGKLEKLKEVEKKKQELARKVLETEERRKAEELARQKRLEEDQRKADELRKRQLDEANKMKKEEVQMAREIERKQKEFLDKQKMKHRMEEDKRSGALKTPRKYPPPDPVYMEDGFQFLNSDEEADPVDKPVPSWSTSKARYIFLSFQNRIPIAHIDRLFSVREQTPDLREIFPNIDRSRLKRTSSAVWHTPTRLAPLAE